MKDLKREMANRHEEYLVQTFGGRRTRGSGNQFNNPMDGRQDRYRDTFAFAWDGKSTTGESISISRAMWRKAVEQAGGERPMLPLRFYANEALTRVEFDLVTVLADDLVEILEKV